MPGRWCLKCGTRSRSGVGVLEAVAEGLEGGGEGVDASAVEEGVGGDLEDDAVVEAVFEEALEEAAPGDDVVEEGLVVVFFDVVAVDVGDAAEDGLGRLDGVAIVVGVPVAMTEVPADGDVALRRDSQQLVVAVADALAGLVGVGSDLEFDGDADLGGMIPAPLAGPGEEGDGAVDEVVAGFGGGAGSAVDVDERRGVLSVGGFGGKGEESLVEEAGGVILAVGEVGEIEDAALGVRVHRQLQACVDAAGGVGSEDVGLGFGSDGGFDQFDAHAAQEREDVPVAIEAAVGFVLCESDIEFESNQHRPIMPTDRFESS